MGIVITILLIYFLPYIIAILRKTKNRTQVLVVNLFLGWTFIGWVVALTMSGTSDIEKENKPDPETKKEIEGNDSHQKRDRESKRILTEIIITAVIFFIIIISFVIRYMSFKTVISLPFIWLIAIFKIPTIQKKSKMFKIISSATLFIVSITWFSYILYHERTPTIRINIENEASFQTNLKVIDGVVKPAYSTLKINYETIKINADGNFSHTVSLKEGRNEFNFVAENHKNQTKTELTINRVLTPEEVVEREKKEVEKIAAEKAKQEAYYKTPAGKICKAHPEWSKTDCELLANDRIWIGMSIDMLKYLNGLPDSANPSNYGRGTQWQWCWHDYTPSCFYGGDDGIITSYN